jgi:hypothetical protein
MESKLKYTEELDIEATLKQAVDSRKDDMFHDDSKAIKSIVNNVCNINIENASRKRELVEGRIIYAKLMRSAGYPVVKIGKSIKKDHATILHYSKIFDFLLKTVRPFRMNYERCSSLFFNNLDTVRQDDFVDYKAEYMLYKEENERMKSVVEKAEELQDRYNRVKDIVELIIERTPIGKEDIVHKKVNAILNGINQ